MLPIQTLIRHEAAVLSVALQGDLLLSGSEDNDVKVINLYCSLPLHFRQKQIVVATKIREEDPKHLESYF